jgi:hypothetical protein
VSKWLKFVGVFAVVGLVMAVIAGVAQGPVDEDGDGACDLCGEQVSEGVMRGWRFNQNVEAQMEGRGPFADDNEMPCDDYVDEDGDGVCDLCGEQVGGSVMRGWRFSQSNKAQLESRGPFAEGEGMPCDDYVDEDGDGVCDNHDDAIVQPNDGRGTRGGMRGGRMQDGQGRP